MFCTFSFRATWGRFGREVSASHSPSLNHSRTPSVSSSSTNWRVVRAVPVSNSSRVLTCDFGGFSNLFFKPVINDRENVKEYGFSFMLYLLLSYLEFLF